jgi:hypothetical protein
MRKLSLQDLHKIYGGQNVTLTITRRISAEDISDTCIDAFKLFNLAYTTDLTIEQLEKKIKSSCKVSELYRYESRLNVAPLYHAEYITN